MSFCKGELPRHLLPRVNAHLASCGSCWSVLAAVLGTRSATEPSDALRGCQVWKPGDRVVNRFLIQRFIGRGGMGEVYEALDSCRGHSVALKTVRLARSNNREDIQRLVSEAQLAQRIVHPNVCRTYETNADGPRPDGTSAHYLVMEYVEGRVLADRLREHGALGSLEAWRIGREVLSGLEAIHRAGILHLDLKCDNIIMRAREGCLRVTITDFGLARAVPPEGALLNEPGRTEGTLSHMAPEQFLGGPLTPATDIFAFGVTLFEMLTARLPFPAPTIGTQLLRSRSTTNPRLLLRQLTTDLPSLLADFVARCVETSPLHRYADATAALKVFDAVLAFPRTAIASCEQPRMSG